MTHQYIKQIGKGKKVITVEVAYARGRAKGSKGKGKADIIVGESIRLYGNLGWGTDRLNEEKYDRTFKIGDIAEYDSYNLSYLGKITKITAKQIWITEYYGPGNVNNDRETHRLDLAEFEWRNYNLNLERTRERNAAISQCI